jgi:serine/threonine protein kinase
MSSQALKYGKYSPSSDVWSYGMVLFEIWSLGSSPYPTMTSEKVFKWLTSLSEDHDDGDYIQYPPPGCPRFMYSMMVKCWRFDHHSRPTFGEIVAMLSGANEYELTVSDANVENSELAAHLGAPLGSAVGLYSDLRHSQ